MELLKISLRNFRPYYDTTTFRPDVEADRPLVLVKGKNDTGKTSLFEAIRFCLFGVDSREERSEVINRKAAVEADGRTEVELTFEHDDQVYIIRRWVEFNQATTADERRAKSWDREVTTPSQTIVEAGSGEPTYRKFINKFIPENVAQFFLFDAEKLERFEEDHDSTVRESIETVLGIQEIENAIDDIQDRKQKFERNLSDVKSTSQQVERLRDQYTEQLEKIDRIGDEDEGQIHDKKEQIRQKKQRLTDVEQALTKAEGLEQVKSQRDEKTAKLKEKQAELREELIPTRNDLRREVGPIITQAGADAFTEHYEIEGAQGETQVISRILEHGTCLCGDDLSNDQREELIEKFSRLQGSEHRRLLAAKRAAEDLDINVEAKLREYQDVRTSIQDAQREIDTLESEIEELEGQITDIEEQYSEDLQTQKEELESAIAELEDEVDDLVEQRGAAKQERDRIKKRIESMGGASEQEQRYSALISLAKSCRDAFKDVKNELVDSRREAVQQATSDTFLKLTNRPDYYKGIKITQNYELRILTEGAERSIDEQRPSAGQRQIIAYSFIAGLSKYTTRDAPVLIDTPIGRLDPEHKNNLVNLYHEFSNQVIILYQPNELSEEDIETMAPRIATEFEITVTDDEESTVTPLSSQVSATADD